MRVLCIAQLTQSDSSRGSDDDQAYENRRPTDGVLGRLALALIKETGIRLSAEDVQVLRPIIVAAIRSIRRRGNKDRPSHTGKGRSIVH
jgi:hypothetical protein